MYIYINTHTYVYIYISQTMHQKSARPAVAGGSVKVGSKSRSP